jgi:AcrR family transcriptional regulator
MRRSPHSVAFAQDNGGVATTRRAVWTENRERLIETARTMFAERGYRGTTTRDLALAAGVAEPTLFRHFPSKAALFDAAVLSPVHDFLHEFVERHRAHPIGERDVYEATRSFYSELYAELTRDSPLLIAVVAALAFEESDTELTTTLQPKLRGLLSGLDEHFADEFGTRRFGIDSSLALRIMFGSVLGLAVHGEWLFADGPPDADRLVDAMTLLTVSGLTGGGQR